MSGSLANAAKIRTGKKVIENVTWKIHNEK
jgi:hypothetical protein